MNHRRPTAASGKATLRIGDVEREHAVSALGDHYAAGRLDRTELDERLGAAYRAKTAADLSPLFADLPGTGGVPAVGPSRPAVTGRRRRSLWVVPVLVLLLSFLFHGLLVGRHGGQGYEGPPPFFLVVLVWFAITRRRAWR